MIQKLIDVFADKPRFLFLLDFGGAITTAFFLAVIMREFNEFFGMPLYILTYLSIVAFCLSVYSFVCFRFVKKEWPTSFRIIAFANLSYCIMTLCLTIIYLPVLSGPGVSYFVAELMIIAGLSYIELKVAHRLKEGSLK